MRWHIRFLPRVNPRAQTGTIISTAGVGIDRAHRVVDPLAVGEIEGAQLGPRAGEEPLEAGGGEAVPLLQPQADQLRAGACLTSRAHLRHTKRGRADPRNPHPLHRMEPTESDGTMGGQEMGYRPGAGRPCPPRKARARAPLQRVQGRVREARAERHMQQLPPAPRSPPPPPPFTRHRVPTSH